MDRRLFIYSASIFGLVFLFINKYFLNDTTKDLFCGQDFKKFINSIPEKIKNYDGRDQDIEYLKNKIQKLGRINFEDFESEILIDYKSKKTIQVRGWVISKTEINLTEIQLKSNC